MKKIVLAILAVSFIGTILTGILMHQHYYPDVSFLCGSGLHNPCVTIGQSDYALIFGIPVAAIGLMYFIVFLFLSLIADYAQGDYKDAILAILLPLSFFGIAADIFYAVIMFHIGDFCHLCALTYVVNIILFTLLLVWFYKEKKGKLKIFNKAFKQFFHKKNDSEKRFASASFFLFILMLLFSVFISSYVLKIKTEQKMIPAEDLKGEINKFYALDPVQYTFPNIGIKVGNKNAKIVIYAFTDFLCTWCYELFKMEKYFMSKYRNKVKVVYFNYPLDAECNKTLKDSMYKNSCHASRAMIAAQTLGISTEYILYHFNNYNKIKRGYSLETAVTLLQKVLREKNKSMTPLEIKTLINSKKINAILQQHINLANKLAVMGTPTVYFANRKMPGLPTRQIFNGLIREELNILQKKK